MIARLLYALDSLKALVTPRPAAVDDPPEPVPLRSALPFLRHPAVMSVDAWSRALSDGTLFRTRR